MTFNQEFLRELNEKLKDSYSYRMTKQSVEFLLKSRQLYEDDKKIIFDAISNDTFCNDSLCKKDTLCNKDPLSLRNFWNNKKIDSKLRF